MSWYWFGLGELGRSRMAPSGGEKQTNHITDLKQKRIGSTRGEKKDALRKPTKRD